MKTNLMDLKTKEIQQIYNVEWQMFLNWSLKWKTFNQDISDFKTYQKQ